MRDVFLSRKSLAMRRFNMRPSTDSYLTTLTVLVLVLFVTGSAFAQGVSKKITLAQAITEAIHNNRAIKEAVEQEQAAIEGEKKVKADLLPKLSTSYSYSHLKNEPFTFLSFESMPLSPLGISIPASRRKVPIGSKDNITWDFDITQPLFTGFALITKRKLASMDIDLKKVLKEQAILDVIKKVKVGYLNILLARRALEVASEEVSQLQAHLHDAQHLYKQGVIPYNDLLKSQVALAQARQNKVKAKSNLDVAISALNVLLDRRITEDTEIQELPPFSPSSYELTSLFNSALRHRPELKQLEIALKQAQLGVRLAKSTYFPQIYLDGRYERKGDNWAASNNDFQNDHNTILSVNLTWSLFEWGKRGAGVAEALHKKKALQEKIEEVKNSILLEVKQAYQQLMVSQENIHTAIEALGQAKENFRITDLQYKEGITTSTEVLDARTFLTQAEFNYHRALYGYRIAQAELERAIGAR